MFANDVLEQRCIKSNSPEAIDKIFKIKIGAAQKGVTKPNGKALFNAAKARYMFNAFIESFNSESPPR